MQTQIISYLNIHCQNWEQMAAIDFPSRGVLSWGFEYEEIRIMCIQLLRQLWIHSIWKEITKIVSESGKRVKNCGCINNFSTINWQYINFFYRSCKCDIIIPPSSYSFILKASMCFLWARIHLSFYLAMILNMLVELFSARKIIKILIFLSAWMLKFSAFNFDNRSYWMLKSRLKIKTIQ